MTDQPVPALLGYRPRIPWRPPPDFGVPAVELVSSVSDCMVQRVPKDEPEWDRVNVALHYNSASEARSAAARAGVLDFEVHATHLYPLMFDNDGAHQAAIRLTSVGTCPCTVSPVEEAVEVLGYDVVEVRYPADFNDAGDLVSVNFDCSPLSCNLMGAEIAVNRRCLIGRWEDAIAAAIVFGRDKPEPGPYMIVRLGRALL